MAKSVCPSCFEEKECSHEWHPDVPRPDHVVEDLICDDCHASLRRVAGEDRHPMTGAPPPHPASLEAREGLRRMTRRNLL